MDDRYVVSPWVTGPAPDKAVGRALVLPGAGYTVDHPALYWACQVLVQVGWRVVTMRWRADHVSSAERRTFVETAADLLDTEAGDNHQTLVLAKSLGSYAAGWASARRYPAVWLTPVMTDDFVARSLQAYAAPSLLIGGTADPMWSTPGSTPPGQRVVELPGVDHGLSRRADWHGSIDALGQSLAAIEDFARTNFA
ncbi:MAG: hypothetical protein QM650_00735 [Microlunatus sp.]